MTWLDSSALHVLFEGFAGRNVGLLSLWVGGVEESRCMVAGIALNVCGERWDSFVALSEMGGNPSRATKTKMCVDSRWHFLSMNSIEL